MEVLFDGAELGERGKSGSKATGRPVVVEPQIGFVGDDV